MNYLDRLSQLAKKEYTGANLGLARVGKVLQLLDEPQNRYPVIHIAGTNGKGSTAAIIHSILSEAGYRVGLYTSPHFLDCRERIRIDDSQIPESELEKLARTIFKAKDFLRVDLSFFEILTLIAFEYFAEERIDILVAEVGLGGRLDATNTAKNKLACILTSIEHDHTEILGRELAKIAREKAGIIRRGVPVIAHTGHHEMDSIINDICKQKKSPVFFLGRDFQERSCRFNWSKKEQFFTYSGIYSSYKNLSMRLLGKHQARNASLALACIEILQKYYGYKIDDRSLFSGLSKSYWPGRFEIISRRISNVNRIIILDGAHNVSGAKAFIDALSNSPYAKESIVLAMSIMQDKDYRKMCELFSTVAKKVIIFQANSSRALANDLLTVEWQKYLPPKKILSVENMEQISYALDKSERIICITGSLYALAAAKSLLSR